MIICPECGSTNIIKAGHAYRKRKQIQNYRCKSCLKQFVEKGEKPIETNSDSGKQ